MDALYSDTARTDSEYQRFEKLASYFILWLVRSD